MAVLSLQSTAFASTPPSTAANVLSNAQEHSGAPLALPGLSKLKRIRTRREADGPAALLPQASRDRKFHPPRSLTVCHLRPSAGFFRAEGVPAEKARSSAASSNGIASGLSSLHLSEWPAPLDMGLALGERMAAAKLLNTIGRPQPPVTPQAVGCYMPRAAPSGHWPVNRSSLAGAVRDNLRRLADAPEADQRQLHLEITLHWHCLCEVEKHRVLESFEDAATAALLGDAGADDPAARTPVRTWIEHTFFHMPGDERDRLLAATSLAARKSLGKSVHAHEHPELAASFKRFYNNKPLDHQYDYAGFMKANRVIGTLPEASKGKKIAIVGAGAAGLCAARTLAEAGVENLTVIEATPRIGGRMRAMKPEHRDGSRSPSRFEMGAMRFPPSAELLMYYLKLLGVEMQSGFPNPGTVPTRFFFDNKVSSWNPGEAPEHEVLQKVRSDFQRVIASIVEPMEQARGAGDTAKMRALWQDHVRTYDKLHFKEATAKLLKDHGIAWSDTEFAAFGAVGIGMGGVSPIYEVGFLEILRVILDHCEVDQQFLPKGTTDAMERFASTPLVLGDGTETPSLRERNAFRFDTQVTGMSSKAGQTTLTLRGAYGQETAESYDAVIFTGSLAAARELKLLERDDTLDPVLSEFVAKAAKEMNCIASSKLFIQVDNPPWIDDPDFPRVFQTEDSAHQGYFLNYPGSKRGVILVSYTWNGKSAENEALAPEERLQEFRRQVAKFSPEMAQCMENPVDGKVYCVDWQNDPNQRGAFKLDGPGDAEATNHLYSQFQSRLGNVYLAGDGVSNKGGWVVGALETAINASLAAFEKIGGIPATNSPLTQDAKLYDYEG